MPRRIACRECFADKLGQTLHTCNMPSVFSQARGKCLLKVQKCIKAEAPRSYTKISKEWERMTRKPRVSGTSLLFPLVSVHYPSPSAITTVLPQDLCTIKRHLQLSETTPEGMLQFCSVWTDWSVNTHNRCTDLLLDTGCRPCSASHVALSRRVTEALWVLKQKCDMSCQSHESALLQRRGRGSRRHPDAAAARRLAAACAVFARGPPRSSSAGPPRRCAPVSCACGAASSAPSIVNGGGILDEVTSFLCQAQMGLAEVLCSRKGTACCCRVKSADCKERA